MFISFSIQLCSLQFCVCKNKTCNMFSFFSSPKKSAFNCLPQDLWFCIAEFLTASHLDLFSLSHTCASSRSALLSPIADSLFWKKYCSINSGFSLFIFENEGAKNWRKTTIILAKRKIFKLSDENLKHFEQKKLQPTNPLRLKCIMLGALGVGKTTFLRLCVVRCYKLHINLNFSDWKFSRRIHFKYWSSFCRYCQIVFLKIVCFQFTVSLPCIEHEKIKAFSLEMWDTAGI